MIVDEETSDLLSPLLQSCELRTTVNNGDLIVEWNNRLVPRAQATRPVLAIVLTFWMLITAATTWMVVLLLQDQNTDRLYLHLLWLPFSYAILIYMLLHWLACSSTECVVFGRDSYRHFYGGHQWLFPRRRPIEDVSAVVLGYADEESAPGLYVRHRGRADHLAAGATLEFQRELFAHIAKHLESVNSQVPAVNVSLPG